MTRESLSEYVTFYSWILEDRNEQPAEELGQRGKHIWRRGGRETGEGLSYARDRKEANVAVMWVSDGKVEHDKVGEVGRGQVIVRNLNAIQRKLDSFLIVAGTALHIFSQEYVQCCPFGSLK